MCVSWRAKADSVFSAWFFGVSWVAQDDPLLVKAAGGLERVVRETWLQQSPAAKHKYGARCGARNSNSRHQPGCFCMSGCPDFGFRGGGGAGP